MPVTFVEGDLFLSRAQTLAHGVNCRGKMGKGIAVEFRRRFPDMYQEYRRRCHHRLLKPGGYYLEKTTDPWVLNLATQDRVGGAELAFVASCLQLLAQQHDREGITSIAMPRIAAGLGGLVWQDVKELIQRVAGPLPITVVVYEDFVPGLAAAEPF